MFKEAQGSQAISVANSALGDVTPTITEISTTGKRDISVLVAPLHGQREYDGQGHPVEEMMRIGF
jgi:hypothetical protein